MMDTWGKLLKAQFPTTIPLAASHLQLTHPNQPTEYKVKKFKITNNKYYKEQYVVGSCYPQTETNLILAIDKKIV